jgi:prepilin-type N-terminal cleavage/methylation domain-containing protein
MKTPRQPLFEAAAPAPPNGGGCARCRGPGGRAFTVIELLVVIAIIGTLAAIGLPVFKSFSKSNATISATRQLLDDVALARQRAIASRSDVYLVFVPPNVTAYLGNSIFSPADLRVLTNLAEGQYASYALFASRQVGDQPGRSSPRYLTGWKTLPQGTFIATNKFSANPKYIVNGVSPFQRDISFPFPSTGSRLSLPLPYIGFDYQGRLISARDAGSEIIPLARGSITPVIDANGQYVSQPAEVLEIPPFNSITLSNHVRIDGLTGRTRVERQQIQ